MHSSEVFEMTPLSTEQDRPRWSALERVAFVMKDGRRLHG